MMDNCKWQQKNREGRVIFRNTYFTDLGYTNHSCKENKQGRMPVPCSCPWQCLIAQGDIDFRTQRAYPHLLPQQAGILMEIIAFSLWQKFVFITHVSFNIEQYDSLLWAPVIWGDFTEGGIKQGWGSVSSLSFFQFQLNSYASREDFWWRRPHNLCSQFLRIQNGKSSRAVLICELMILQYTVKTT